MFCYWLGGYFASGNKIKIESKIDAPVEIISSGYKDVMNPATYIMEKVPNILVRVKRVIRFTVEDYLEYVSSDPAVSDEPFATELGEVFDEIRFTDDPYNYDILDVGESVSATFIRKYSDQVHNAALGNPDNWAISNVSSAWINDAGTTTERMLIVERFKRNTTVKELQNYYRNLRFDSQADAQKEMSQFVRFIVMAHLVVLVVVGSAVTYGAGSAGMTTMALAIGTAISVTLVVVQMSLENAGYHKTAGLAGTMTQMYGYANIVVGGFGSAWNKAITAVSKVAAIATLKEVLNRYGKQWGKEWSTAVSVVGTGLINGIGNGFSFKMDSMLAPVGVFGTIEAGAKTYMKHDFMEIMDGVPTLTLDEREELADLERVKNERADRMANPGYVDASQNMFASGSKFDEVDKNDRPFLRFKSMIDEKTNVAG